MKPSDIVSRRRELILRFLSDENAGVRSCASRALEKLESKADMETWLRYLREGAGKEIRIKAIYALCRLRNEKILPALLEVARSSEEDLKAALVRALRERDDKEVADIFVELLEDPSPTVRALTAEAIGHKRYRNLVPYLLAHLNETSVQVLEQVIHALGKIGDPVAEKPLIGMLNHPEPKIRGLVLLALGELDFPD